MTVGLTRLETLSIPYSELLDLIAIEQIKHEGKKLAMSDEDKFWKMMAMR